jgi:hypothetical protein
MSPLTFSHLFDAAFPTLTDAKARLTRYRDHSVVSALENIKDDRARETRDEARDATVKTAVAAALVRVANDPTTAEKVGAALIEKLKDLGLRWPSD